MKSVDNKMNGLNKEQLNQLQCGIGLLNISKYLEVRKLYPQGDTPHFRDIYKRYYHLNVAQLSEQFLDHYFNLLFSQNIGKTTEPYSQILRELYDYPNRRGLNTLQFSFVSKLMATRDENRPVYDKHVRDFFKLSMPSGNDVNARIAQYIYQLSWLRETYELWQLDSNFKEIVAQVRDKYSLLIDCPATRVADLLVYTVGKHNRRCI